MDEIEEIPEETRNHVEKLLREYFDSGSNVLEWSNFLKSYESRKDYVYDYPTQEYMLEKFIELKKDFIKKLPVVKPLTVEEIKAMFPKKHSNCELSR
jgi:hypothetical protein